MVAALFSIRANRKEPITQPTQKLHIYSRLPPVHTIYQVVVNAAVEFTCSCLSYEGLPRLFAIQHMTFGHRPGQHPALLIQFKGRISGGSGDVSGDLFPARCLRGSSRSRIISVSLGLDSMRVGNTIHMYLDHPNP